MYIEVRNEILIKKDKKSNPTANSIQKSPPKSVSTQPIPLPPILLFINQYIGLQ